MPISLNEIRARAAVFSEEWKDACYEKGETQTFYNELFEVFGNKRRNVAVYEEKVKKLDDRNGFIDLFWPGKLLVEQKSAGRNLSAAREQATEYFVSITEKERPRYILLSDFQHFELLDLEENEEHHFTLSELPEKVRLLAFIAGYQQQKYRDQDPANVYASMLMSNLHEQLESNGYTGHDLERLLVRIMFCLFAEDTGIFEPESFLRLIEDKTNEDGSDLGSCLVHLFQILDTPPDKRQKNLDEDLDAFPYVNGNLFAEGIKIPSFDREMREALLGCAYFDWTKVSPALFGSLFQTVMLPEKQRKGGAHYTSERNILKAIKPLFHDELVKEFKKIKALKNNKKARLQQFQDKLANLAFFDPACGCGNFLILAFRELRKLELEVIKELCAIDKKEGMLVLDISQLTKVSVNQFHGIEIEEFPARIAEVAMWLVDHQMNMMMSEQFGLSFVRLPLKDCAHIHHANALTTDWTKVLAPNQCDYILGNPPFLGKKEQSKEQKRELRAIFQDVPKCGELDYVSCWFMKAAQYIKGTNARVAFVATKSVSQGEQVKTLWEALLGCGCEIFFAHNVFKWTIDEDKAKGMNVASVHVIIVGFANTSVTPKYIYEYETVASDPHRITVRKINPYLVEGENVLIDKRHKPLCNTIEINKGSEATDFGHLMLSPSEKEELLKDEPGVEKWIKRVYGSKELINGIDKYCLWLVDASPQDLRSMPKVMERVQRVKTERLESSKPRTREWAKKPSLFSENRQPEQDYLAIPKVSSRTRDYIPIDFVPRDIIATGSLQVLPEADLYEFGILISNMHMCWMRYVGGRTKSDYQYSNTIVYNNFPWPKISKKSKEGIMSKAQAVLDARKEFPGNTLADLYDPNAMPPALVQAHLALDKAVDKAYRKSGFKSDKERMEFLLERYQRLVDY